MRTFARLAIGTAAAAAILGGLAVPASAATSPVTAAVSGGALSISAPGSYTIPPIAPGGSAQASGQGAVTVTDQRAGTTGWTASVQITPFTAAAPAGGGTAPAMPATAAAYGATTATVTGGDTVTAAGAAGDISRPTPVETATAVNGNNAASWTPLLQLTAPAQALAGSYTATLTHSVA